MASGGLARELSEELSCPICLDYFSDPVILPECGHNFCRDCLTRGWAAAAAEPSCPLCKRAAQPKNLLPNRQLANLVEIAQKLSRPRGEARLEGAREGICKEHGEPLRLFCQTNETLICTDCHKSKEHKNHKVVPALEAAQEYKDKFFNRLEILRTEMEKIMVHIADVEDESQEMLKRTEETRQQTVAEFRTLHQLLNEHENDLLALIEETEKEVARKKDEHLTSLSVKVSSLERLIQEMEEKCQQPVSELLQDVSGTLQRYQKRERFGNPESFMFRLKSMLGKHKEDIIPEAFPSELKQGVHECLYNRFLKTAMKPFQDSLPWAFQKLRAKVTLDPASANSHLVLSSNQKTMTWQSMAKVSSEEPEKHYGFVLGREGFRTGCHFWEVHVGNLGDWAVGVARKPVKGRINFAPEEGIWVVGRWKDQYKAFIKGTDPPLTLRGKPFCLRVCLNYDEGQVAFFDTYRAALLYEFSGASFCGETLYPFFAVYGHHGWLEIFP